VDSAAKAGTELVRDPEARQSSALDLRVRLAVGLQQGQQAVLQGQQRSAGLVTQLGATQLGALLGARLLLDLAVSS
jgi:hypothetical protein